MNTYKNNSPFPVILDLKSGRKILKPKEEFKTDEEIAVPGIEKVGFVTEEVIKTFPGKPEPKTEVVPITNILQSLFDARFGRK